MVTNITTLLAVLQILHTLSQLLLAGKFRHTTLKLLGVVPALIQIIGDVFGAPNPLRSRSFLGTAEPAKWTYGLRHLLEQALL